MAVPAFAVADEFGNRIADVKFTQKVAGSSEEQDWIVYPDYIENMTIDLKRHYDINITSTIWVNITEAAPHATEYAALAIQFFFDDGYQGPMDLFYPSFDAPDGFVAGGYIVPELIDNPNIDFQINVSRWQDYEKNGTWVLDEEFIFFCDVADATEYEPELYGGMDLGFIWFWLAFGGVFFTAISMGAAVKKVSLKYGIVALLSGMFTYAFFMIIAAGG